MWRLVLTVSLLSCSSEGSVSCKDENGKDVDWYILYKTPRNQNEGLDGLDYVYIYPDNNNKAKHQKNTKKINDSNGILAHTLDPLFKFDKKNPTPNFGFISYNDGVPKGYSARVRNFTNKEGGSAPDSFGHSKGVVMVQKVNNGGTGVWLLHSTPNFPYDRKPDNFWPKSGARNGQTFICVTFPYTAFKDIGTHLQRIRAFPFDHHIPKGFHEELQEATNETNKNHNTLTNNQFPAELKKLTSSGGKEFGCIAKQVLAKDEGKPGAVLEDGDLYYSISTNNLVKSDVDVLSWGCQPDRDGSFCSGTKKVQNVLFVKTDWGKWDSGSDHSKWCVAVDQNKPWTCIADVNRSESQYKRLGGALCIVDVEVANIFRGFAEYVDECPGPSPPKIKHVSSSSSNSG